jgi:hypothetical protein
MRRPALARRCLYSVSIHAPHTGSDDLLFRRQLRPQSRSFNPRSPHGERHAERDWALMTTMRFNPRSPHGERPRCLPASTLPEELQTTFQSTLPTRGATQQARKRTMHNVVGQFQSTLPTRGATSRMSARRMARRAPRAFQSTLPTRGATIQHG